MSRKNPFFFNSRFQFLSTLLLLALFIGCVVQPVSAVDPPNASFSCTPLSGLSPLSVTCTDSSTNSPTGWAWFFGDETYTNGWTQINSSSGWTARVDASMVILTDNNIVLMGGQDITGANKNDTWRSLDGGNTWQRMNSSSGWGTRYLQSAVALPDKSIVLMGGRWGSSSQVYNDVWRSTDEGATWTQQNASAGWPARYGQSAVALPDSSIVLMGGYSGGYKNDVWKSADNGITWLRVNASPGWASRYEFTTAAYPDNSFILVGGSQGSSPLYNDTWRSEDDGFTWVQMNSSGQWAARNQLSSVVMPDSSAVLFGGIGGSVNWNDTWRTTDNGAHWLQINSSSGWTARYGLSGVVNSSGTVVLSGGYTTNYKNDTWQFDPTGSHLQNPVHSYTASSNGQYWNASLKSYNLAGYNNTIKNLYVRAFTTSPIASFAMKKTTGDGQSLVSFTDTSSAIPISWNWTSNGTTFSTLQNPQKLFATGNYSIILNSSNPAGYNISTSQWVNVSAVTAAFSGTPMSGQTPLPVAFSDASTGSPSQWAWFFGDENYMQPWTNVTGTPGWVARYGSGVVAMPNGDIIMMGGKSIVFGISETAYNDTWKSTDKGITWTLMNASSGWSVRYFITPLAMPDGSIVLFGGGTQSNPSTNDVWTNDTWRSVDEGSTWSKINSSSGWQPRDSMGAAVTNGVIVVTGGANINGGVLSDYNDTWSSSDNGYTWQLMNASSGYSSREHFQMVSLQDGSLVMSGGIALSPFVPVSKMFNDSWKSIDYGAHWTQMNATASWISRNAPFEVAMPDNSILLMGGQNSLSSPNIDYNDSYRTTDYGASWQKINATNGWSARNVANMVLMPDGSIVLIGGGYGTNDFSLNDTWRLSPQGSNLQNPTHQYVTPGNYSVSEMVTGAFGSNTLTKTDYIFAEGVARSGFVPKGPLSVWYPNGIGFKDNSLANPGYNTWNWSWGDGTYSTAQNPYKFWYMPGVYTVSLNASNALNYSVNSTVVQVMRF